MGSFARKRARFSRKAEEKAMLKEQRYENMLPTIITTNCTMNELKDRVGERTASRIIEMTTPYKITASDYRLKARK